MFSGRVLRFFKFDAFSKYDIYMKTLLIISWLCFCQILAAQPVTINNAQLEEVENGQKEPIKHWNPIENSGYTYVLDNQNPHKGQYSLKITHQSGNNEARIRQVLFIQSDKPQKYTLSVAIRTKGVTGTAGAYINVWEGNTNTLVFFEDMSRQNISGTRGWQRYSADIFITAKTTKLVLGFKMSGKGTTWFDDIRLEPFKPQKPISQRAKGYLDTAVNIIRQNALYKDSVNWQYVEHCLPIFSEGAQTTADCYPTIRFVLEQLGDKHSSLTEPEAQQAWLQEKTEEELFKIPFAEGQILDKNIGYIQMKRFSSGNLKEQVIFADSLHRLIKKLDEVEILSHNESPTKTGLRGWIVDLRENTGGNCWPMLAGIGPILGEGVAGYFASPDLNKKEFNYELWGYEHGFSVSEKGVKMVEVTKPYKVKKELPVAVLIGEKTGSSGEVIVTSFKNHPRARLFGEPTGGFSTANWIYNLSDNATIELTTSVYADRKKVHYGKKIEPDVIAKNTTANQDLTSDSVIKEALGWLKK
jgi:Peptidase family S41